MEQSQFIIGIIGAIVGAVVTYFMAIRKNIAEYVTKERHSWRKKLRRLSCKLSSADDPALILNIIARLKNYLNPYGKNFQGQYLEKKDIMEDAQIWQTIHNIEKNIDASATTFSSDLYNEKTLLVTQLQLLLKYDWERSKREMGLMAVFQKIYPFSQIFKEEERYCTMVKEITGNAPLTEDITENENKNEEENENGTLIMAKDDSLIAVSGRICEEIAKKIPFEKRNIRMKLIKACLIIMILLVMVIDLLQIINLRLNIRMPSFIGLGLAALTVVDIIVLLLISQSVDNINKKYQIIKDEKIKSVICEVSKITGQPENIDLFRKKLDDFEKYRVRNSQREADQAESSIINKGGLLLSLLGIALTIVAAQIPGDNGSIMIHITLFIMMIFFVTEVIKPVPATAFHINFNLSLYDGIVQTMIENKVL